MREPTIGATLLERNAPPPLLDGALAAAYLGLGERTLENWRVRGSGPPFLRVGRAIRYDQNDLTTWLNARRFANTGQADAANAQQRTPEVEKSA